MPGSTRQEEPLDCWVRAPDFIVQYGPTAGRSSQATIYWRELTSSAASGVEVIVAVRTELLDDQPQAAVSTALEAVEVWHLADSDLDGPGQRVEIPSSERIRGPLLVRLPFGMTYLQLVYPSDDGGTLVGVHDGLTILSTPLFQEHLEKGVIRQSRLRGWFVPTTGDVAAARRLYRELVVSEPALTT